jgi:hypothetical protein
MDKETIISNTGGIEPQSSQQAQGDNIDTTASSTDYTNSIQSTETLSEIDRITQELGFDKDDPFVKELKSKYETNKVKEPKESTKEEPKFSYEGKEYTKDELEKFFEEKYKPQEQRDAFRQDIEIANDYESIKINVKQDLSSIISRYVNISTPDQITDDNGKVTHNYQSVLTSMVSAIKTGDYKEVAKYLPFEHIIAMKEEIESKLGDYQQKEKNLLDEFSRFNQSEKVKEWDGYIKDNKFNTKENLFISELKKLYPENFTKNEVDNLLKIFRTANAVEINQKELNKETDNIKKAMINTNTTNPPITPQIFTPQDISKMSNETFNKLLNEGVLDKYLK